MTRLVKRATLAMLPVLALAVGDGGPARADFVATVTPTVTTGAGGTSLFSYLVAVDPTSTTPLTEFDLALTTASTSGIFTPVGATIMPLASPAGFLDTYTPGDPVIMYTAAAGTAGIAPGTSGLFSFTGPSTTALEAYQLLDDGVGAITSAAIGPAVPEPASLVLFGLGALCLTGLGARRGRARKPSA